MRRTSIRSIMGAAMLLPAIISCKEDLIPDYMQKESVTVSIECDDMTEAETKSSFTWSDTRISHYELFMVNNATGKVEDHVVQSGTSAVSLSAPSGTRCTIYALVNVGPDIDPKTLSDLESVSLAVSYTEIARYGIPMSGSASYTFSGGSGSLRIPVTRLLARIDLKVDTSRLVHKDAAGGFTVTSAGISNALSEYQPFAGSIRQTKSTGIDYDFDYASSSDLKTLNDGGTISLYVFENMQGTKLSGNTDPWSKVPEKVSASERCSFLEVSTTYKAQGLTGGDITYRMYLGSNSTSNFDIRRNTIYTITLIPTEDEIDGQRGNWKVSSRDWSDTRSIRFDPMEISVPSLGSASARVVLSPSKFDVDVMDTEWLKDAGSSYSYDKTSGTLTVKNNTAITKDVTDYLCICSWDGRCEYYLKVTVKAQKVPASLSVSPSSVSVLIGKSQPLVATVTYSDGSTAVVNPEYSIATKAIAKIEGQSVIGVSAGTTSLGATYTENGKTVNARPVPVTVTSKEALTPSQATLDTYGGKSYALTFTYTSSTGATSTVTPVLTNITYSVAGTPAILSYSAGKLVAKDWWGMSGSWVKAGNTYTATFAYNGITTTVKGTVHGVTGFKDIAFSSAIYKTVTNRPPVKTAYLTGSEDISIKNSITFTIDNTTSRDYVGSYLKVGTYNTSYSVVDPTNGMTRTGSTKFDVITDVRSISATVTLNNLSIMTGATGLYKQTFTVSSPGQVMFSYSIPTNGHDETTFDIIFEDLKYQDVYGIVHNLTSLGPDDYGSLPPTRKTTWGCMPQDDGMYMFSINGFYFYVDTPGL